MSKIAILTDTHFGCHSASKHFIEYHKRFFDEVFFPFIEKNNIKYIFDLGDTFDSRKNISYEVLSASKEFFFNRVENENLNLYSVVGNHNSFYKNTIDINSNGILFEYYNNIHAVEKPTEIKIDDVGFLFVPWLCQDNKEEILKAISETKSKYLLGHFEVMGIELHKNWQFYKGLEHKILDKFDKVLSGHYHIKLEKDNFIYLGMPYQNDWADVYHDKGFYVFDTKTKELEFIKNDLKIYKFIEYSENEEDFRFEEYKNCFVKIYLNRIPENNKKFEVFIKSLEEHCIECSVIENYFNEIKVETNEEIRLEEETTLDTIKKKCSDNGVVDDIYLFEYLKKKYVIAMENFD